jgi:hypothetical protein
MLKHSLKKHVSRLALAADSVWTRNMRVLPPVLITFAEGSGRRPLTQIAQDAPLVAFLRRSMSA